jgi:hypothetical protein
MVGELLALLIKEDVVEMEINMAIFLIMEQTIVRKFELI